jgi:hypothetical protein
MTTVTVTTTGAGSFTIPAGVTSILVEGWSAGGGSGNLQTTNEPGGGGGAYASATFSVTAGDQIFWVVGAGSNGADGGDTWFEKNVNSNVNAWVITGGKAPISANPSGGGGAGAVTNGTQGTLVNSFAGGLGAAQQGGGGSRGGGGGGGGASSGGAGFVGGVGSGGTGGIGGASGTGGAGGVAQNTAGNSNVEGGGGGGGGNGGASTNGAGGAPGGGAGGAGSSSTGTQIGGRGQLRYTYTANTPTLIFNPTQAVLAPHLAR